MAAIPADGCSRLLPSHLLVSFRAAQRLPHIYLPLRAFMAGTGVWAERACCRAARRLSAASLSVLRGGALAYLIPPQKQQAFVLFCRCWFAARRMAPFCGHCCLSWLGGERRRSGGGAYAGLAALSWEDAEREDSIAAGDWRLYQRPLAARSAK